LWLWWRFAQQRFLNKGEGGLFMRQHLTLCVLAVCTAGLVGCQSGDQLGSTLDKPSFEEFVASVYQESQSGLYIVDWDVPVASVEGLRPYYDRLYSDGALTVHQENGEDVLWDNTQKYQLTYCVSTSFGDRHKEVITAMADATADWMGAGDVRFIHDASQDGNCTASNESVLFDVNPSSDGQFIARAFFPNSPRDQRNVLIDDSAFNVPSDSAITVHNVLVHELGHALGFRHEHVHAAIMDIPFEAWFNCLLEGFIDSNYRLVGEYDKDSTMHYPQCGGTSDLSLSANDATVMEQLYGPPKGEAPNP